MAATYAAPSGTIVQGPAVVSTYGAAYPGYSAYSHPVVSAYSAYSSPVVSSYSHPVVSAYSAPVVSAYSHPVVSAYSSPVVAGGLVGHNSVDTVIAGPSGTIATSRHVPNLVGAHGLYY